MLLCICGHWGKLSATSLSDKKQDGKQKVSLRWVTHKCLPKYKQKKVSKPSLSNVRVFKGFVSGQWSILPSSFYISVFTFSIRACTENANIIFVNRMSEWINKWGKSKIVSKFNKELTSREKEKASTGGPALHHTSPRGSEILEVGTGARMG